MDLVSIIIPVYNGEKYIQKALESAINQTYKKIEIIVIDDGSTDNTHQIIKNYAKKDKRIIFISKKNGGVGSARNLGLQISKGKFIQFLDSDDTLELNAIKLLINKINSNKDIDFILFGFNVFKNGKLLRTPNVGNHLVRIGKDFDSFKKIEFLMESACDKFYKKSYIEFMYNERLVYAEDRVFNYNNLKNGTLVLSISDCLYNVELSTEESVNKRYKKGKLHDFIYSRKCKQDTLFKIYGDSFDKKEYMISELNSLAVTISTCCNILGFRESKNEILQIDGEIRNYLSEILILRRYAKFYNQIILNCTSKKRYRCLYFLSRIKHLLKNKLFK